MATLPTASLDLSGGVEFVSQPTKTWHVNKDTNRIDGTCDGYTAVRQTVQAILNIERFRWQIYQPYFGMQWDGLIGQDANWAGTELYRRLTDAFSTDDRITGIESYEYEVNDGEMTVDLSVATIYGTVDTSLEVSVT